MTEGALPSRTRGPGLALIVLGLLMPVVAIVAEVRQVGTGGGFGHVQTMGSLLGLAIAAHGVALVSPGQAAWSLRLLVGADWLADLARFGAVLAQVLLFFLVVRTFQLENPAFYQHIVPLTLFGFVVHHFLPARYRLPFFVALSLGGLLLVLGTGNAAWVVAIILAFVGLSRLPIAFSLRVLLVLALGGTLAVLRTGGDTPFSGGIWPVLGSILMFRLIVYLYDLKHAAKKPTIAQTLAYFFLLPNVVFPLFPVVDFATFCRTHYDRDPYEIYQHGLRWILRGITHLLVYRIVYQHFTLAPSEVSTTGNLVQYLLTTFLLYLRVSGQFHVVIGILHLFGFRLPETHHLFYLSSSFTDFWRRINIYWKDFMMKVVFYPVYFPLRKKAGDITALVVGTAAVFAITWLTHSYQWFWILGSVLLSWTDGLFWAILGVILIFGSLQEMKKGRVRAVAMSGWSAGYALKLAGRTAMTFTIICLLWSLWGSHTLGEFYDLMTVRAPTAGEWLLIAGVLAFIGVLAVVADLAERRQAGAGRAKPPAGFQPGVAAWTAAGFALLYIAASPIVVSRLSVPAQEFMREIRVPSISQRDQAQMQRGYYENLTGVGNQNSQLWELYAQRPAQGADIWQSGVLRDRDDFVGREMRPLFVIFQTGVVFSTNRWGMRDQDYEVQPAAGTRRIAILGQSYVAGDGVSDGETFEQIAEDRINREHGASPTEILNFAVGSYSILQQVGILPRVLEFQPRTVVLVANPVDAEWAALHVVKQLHRGVQPPYQYLRDILARAQVDSSLREAEALSRLRPYQDSILEFSLRLFADEVRAAGATPVWVYLATPEPGPAAAEIARMAAQASEAGFTVLDWSDVYPGSDLTLYQVSPWDFHPNKEGHRIIAERFYRDLQTLGLVPGDSSRSTPRR